MNDLFKYLYEALMVILVAVTIITLWTEHTFNSTINMIVWFIFFVDFIVRLMLAKNKWHYIKSNPFLIIAIIPVDQFFQIARIVRIFYLFRIKTIAKFYINPYVSMLTYRALILFFSLFFMLLISFSGIIYTLENTITTFTKALYVVFGHLLFFGHRIFLIEHMISISLLTIVSISGVIIQGLALQWVFSKAETIYNNFKKSRQQTKQNNSEKNLSQKANESNNYKSKTDENH